MAQIAQSAKRDIARINLQLKVAKSPASHLAGLDTRCERGNLSMVAEDASRF